jgi:hypothetical protein
MAPGCNKLAGGPVAMVAARLMPRFLFAALLPFAALLSAVACDTSAKGINDCREMEYARCTAARGCDFGIDSDEREADCARFSRDNCLHGLSTGVEPKRGQVEACLNVITKAGECAHESGGDQIAIDCEGIGQTQREDVSVCEVIEDPTLASRCAWLLQDPPDFPRPTDGG